MTIEQQAREIQRLEFYVEDDGDSDPFAVPHNDPTGDYVRYADHQKEIAALRARVAELEARIEQQEEWLSRVSPGMYL